MSRGLSLVQARWNLSVAADTHVSRGHARTRLLAIGAEVGVSALERRVIERFPCMTRDQVSGAAVSAWLAAQTEVLAAEPGVDARG